MSSTHLFATFALVAHLPESERTPQRGDVLEHRGETHWVTGIVEDDTYPGTILRIEDADARGFILDAQFAEDLRRPVDASRLDTTSAASRQHCIDTGAYLLAGTAPDLPRVYADQLADTLGKLHAETLHPVHGRPQAIGHGGQTLTAELIDALREHEGGEVYVEIDRAALAEIDNDIRTRPVTGSPTGDLLPYLYPVVVRFDAQGDAIITITTGDRAQAATTEGN